MRPDEILNAPRAEPQPLRAMIDLQIDDAQLRLLSADTPELRTHWAERFIELVRERNAARSTAEIEDMERQRGLR